MKVNIPVEVGAPIINITLPANVPLTCDINKATELFGVGETTLRKLIKKNADMPVKKIGEKLIFLVPDMYAWIRDFPESRIPTD